jgi:hypothetical protein
LLLLRPAAIIVGAVRAYRGPIEARPGERWLYRGSGQPIREGRDRTPIQHVKIQRDAVRARLDAAAGLLGTAVEPGMGDPFERTIGALIVAPTTHPDSRISLDVTEHRQQLKVLGLDELAGLAGLVHTGVELSDESMRAIAADLFGGRLWHDGTRFLFELVPALYQLRVLGEDPRADQVLPLFEGETVIGRRRTSQGYERRLSLGADELISADHALIVCSDDRVTLRDNSKNGSWITPPGGVEERLRGERVIVPGTLLRMGMTCMRLEWVEEATV